MKKTIGMLGMLAASMAIVGTNANANVAGSNKDMAYPVTARANKSQASILSTDANPYKHVRTPKKNQRQKRKHLRQNPYQRRYK